MTDTGGASADEAVLDQGFDAGTLQLLRARVAACVAAAGLPEGRAADVILAVHELAANAVRHGAGAGRLLLRAAGGMLYCQVTDAGPGPDTWPLRQGHGLWIVRQVAERMAMTAGPEGTKITAEFAVLPARRGDQG
ncbi:MAG TPA: ATP-binding protein [Trebonia sp.]